LVAETIDILAPETGISGGRVTRTLVDIDDDNLAAAARVLGTKSKKDTVNAALLEVLRRQMVTGYFHHMATDPLPDLRDGEVMARAWQ
jgi:Arc/MetJ family transcription regulator